MKAKGAPKFCVVFDVFHKERHKAHRQHTHYHHLWVFSLESNVYYSSETQVGAQRFVLFKNYVNFSPNIPPIFIITAGYFHIATLHNLKVLHLKLAF